MSISDEKFKQLKKLNEGYNRAVIPSGSYKGMDVDVPTVSGATVLIVNKDLSADIAYKIVKILGSNLEDVKRINPGAFKGYSHKYMANTSVIPYHPGAAKYYREVGAM